MGEEPSHSNAHHLMTRIGTVHNTTTYCSELLILDYGVSKNEGFVILNSVAYRASLSSYQRLLYFF
jgi:hypothetical protein